MNDPLNVTIIPLTAATVRLSMQCGDLTVSTATGFLWSHDGKDYVVTNWQCLTGVNPLNGSPLDKKIWCETRRRDNTSHNIE